MNRSFGKESGFTLIELLAVIVILAVIALIATPLVLNIIERAEKGAFRDSVYGIMEAAEFQVILDESKYPITFVYPLDSDRIKFKGTKPSEGYLQIVSEGKIKLALGNGRWCAVKDVNDSQVTITDGKCEKIDLGLPIISGYGDLNQTIPVNSNYTMPNVTATDKDGNKLNITTTIKQDNNTVDKIDTSKAGSYTIIYTTEADKEGNISSVTVTITVIKQETAADKVIENGMNGGGLELIEDGYYYVGESPKNWLQFDGVTGDDSIWRIINIENGFMKIVRQSSLGSIAWDNSGDHVWLKPASIHTYLNVDYKNGLSEIIRDKIKTTDYYIGEIPNMAPTPLSAVIENERKTTWVGEIGLINASDYVIANNMEACTVNIMHTSICAQENWIEKSLGGQWTMNAHGYQKYVVYVGGMLFSTSSMSSMPIFPVIHLKEGIKIISGDGSQETPFIVQ